jgi:hypothetical protein
MTSATQAAAFRALGARPSGEGWAELVPALQSGRLGAVEVDLNTYESNAYAGIAPFLTVNVALWPRTTVLFANKAALDELSDRQQGWLRQAAGDAARYSLTTFGEDQRIVQLECRNGMKAVVASHAQLEALRNALSPVYASLRKDPATAKTIAAISALKKRVAATPLTVPRGCVTATRRTANARRATFPEGVYRFERSREDILRVWPNADRSSLQAHRGTVTFTFRRGAFSAVLAGGGTPGCRRGDGRYSVDGQILTTSWTTFHGCPFFEGPTPPLRLRWTYDGTTLRFKLAQPGTPTDHVAWESNPFVRIR